MIRTASFLTVAAASALIIMAAPSPAWAESAAPSGDAADFLNGIHCPESDATPCYDPNASGTKYFGKLTATYDKDGTNCPSGLPNIRNVFFNVTVAQGNSSIIGTTDYRNGVRPHAAGFCFGTQEAEQAYTVMDLVGDKILPVLNCTAGACNFKIKTISNFQYTGGPTSDPFSGGFSADITIAVQ